MSVQVQILSAVLLKHLNSINKNLRKNNMKTISFDIKLRKLIQSEENHYQGRYKVQTKSGKPVRIICWDKKDILSIIALVEIYDSHEAPLLFYNNGKYYTGGDESSYDLCLVDTWKPISEKSEQTDFEKELANCLYKSIGVVSMYGMEVLAKMFTPKLLELAKKEIIEKLKKE